MTVTWWPAAKRDQIVLASNRHLTLRPYESLSENGECKYKEDEQ
jgi:hypothetical protein